MFPMMPPNMGGMMPNIDPMIMNAVAQQMQHMDPAMFAGMGMPMPMPMPGGMHPSVMGPPGPAAPPMGGPPPRADGGGGGGGGMYFKTRMCNNFRNGTCNIPAEQCKYAHGEDDLRQPGQAGPQQGGRRGPRIMTPHGGPINPGQPQAGAAQPPNKVHKTRLCERFMNTGDCPYGARCTFAHGEHELRINAAPRMPGGAMQAGGVMHPGGAGGFKAGHNGQPPAGGPGMKRGPDGGPAGGSHFGGGMPEPKRQRHVGPLAPPAQEVLPNEGSLAPSVLRDKFEQLKHEVARFAAETGHSVALLTVGGILSVEPESGADEFDGDVYTKAVAAKDPRLKLNIFKFGTGGVCAQLVKRPEIVKFVCARGTKALLEMASNAERAAQRLDEQF